MGKRRINATEALLRRARHRPGKTNAAGGSSKASAHSWNSDVDDHGGLA